MPIIQVTLIKGFSDSVKTDLLRRLSQAACATTGVSPEGVSVILNEVASTNFMRGGKLRKPGQPAVITRSPSETVREFLETMEAGDLSEAGKYLANDFTMTFPGGVSFNTLQQLVSWSSQRYKFIQKTFACFDQLQCEDAQIVYCSGTLSGEREDGSRFDGVRFIDRFVVNQSLLYDQRVWNDMAENRQI